MKRLLVVAAAALLASACAATQKKANAGDTVVDGASAKAAAPAPTADADAEAAARAKAAADAEAAAKSCDLVRVRFAFDSAQLDDSAMTALRQSADCISKRKPSALLVEGHCDERGTAQYNIALGARRANAVKKYLADLGVKTKFDTVSFGKELPVAQGSNETAWSQNRRAEMRLPGDTRSDGQAFAGR
jgi:peptidoglycan-associated lipoprotein